MRKRNIPIWLDALLVLSAALLLTSCAGADRPRLRADRPELRIEAGRLQPVAYPAIPPATTPCAHDPARLCNSDAETADVITAYDAALTAANRAICYARSWFGHSACPQN